MRLFLYHWVHTLLPRYRLVDLLGIANSLGITHSLVLEDSLVVADSFALQRHVLHSAQP